MAKACEVAMELRRIADALDKEPETELDRPLLFFNPGSKEQFLAEVRLFPKPLAKSVEHEDSEFSTMVVEGPRDAPVWLRTSVARNLVCRIVKRSQPAEYDCEPLLSQQEEESLP